MPLMQPVEPGPARRAGALNARSSDPRHSRWRRDLESPTSAGAAACAAIDGTARPRQWVKNALVVAAPGAAGALGYDDVPAAWPSPASPSACSRPGSMRSTMSATSPRTAAIRASASAPSPPASSTPREAMTHRRWPGSCPGWSSCAAGPPAAGARRPRLRRAHAQLQLVLAPHPRARHRRDRRRLRPARGRRRGRGAGRAVALVRARRDLRRAYSSPPASARPSWPRTAVAAAARRRRCCAATPRSGCALLLAGSGGGALFAYCVWAFELPDRRRDPVAAADRDPVRACASCATGRWSRPARARLPRICCSPIARC